MVGRSCWLGVSAALLAALNGTPASAAEQVNVATAARVIFSIPYWVAERKGFFKDEGIEPTLHVGATSRQITEQIRAGTTQITIGGPDGALIDATKGGSLRILAGVVRRPPLWLIAKPSIKTIADLRGANNGALSLTEGSSKLLIRMAKAEGLAPTDLGITAVGGAPRRHILLKEGKIDAGMQPLPLKCEAVDAGFNDLGWAGKYEPDWQFITVNADAGWASHKPQVATGFVRALLRGQQFLASNPDEASRIAADELKTSVPLAARSLAEALRLGILDPRLDWSEVGLQRIFENMQADGTVPSEQKFDISKVVVTDYLRAAQASVAAGSK